jgi:hypothetical protein
MGTDLSDELVSDSLPGGYVNLLGPDETAQIADAYGPNHDRLLAVKERYDPASTFSATPLPPMHLTGDPVGPSSSEPSPMADGETSDRVCDGSG